MLYNSVMKSRTKSVLSFWSMNFIDCVRRSILRTMREIKNPKLLTGYLLVRILIASTIEVIINGRRSTRSTKTGSQLILNLNREVSHYGATKKAKTDRNFWWHTLTLRNVTSIQRWRSWHDITYLFLSKYYTCSYTNCLIIVILEL